MKKLIAIFVVLMSSSMSSADRLTPPGFVLGTVGLADVFSFESHHVLLCSEGSSEQYFGKTGNQRCMTLGAGVFLRLVDRVFGLHAEGRTLVEALLFKS